MRTWLLIVACFVVSLVAASAALADVQVTLTTSSKAPTVGERWRWTITAHDGGNPAHARARLQVQVDGIVVGCFKNGAMTTCRGAAAGDLLPFTGSRTGVIRWPAQRVDGPLVFQAVVITEFGTLRLRTPLMVSRAGAS